MKRFHTLCISGLLSVFAITPLSASVAIQSLTPSAAPPQPLGTVVTWTVKATDSQANTLTFQFSVIAPNGTLTMVKDFNSGTLTAGVWTSQPFAWATIAAEGTYTIQVIAKDFISGETATKTARYQLNTLVPGGVAAVHRAVNALVAIFSSPSCDTGSTMRVAFYTGSNAPAFTPWAVCTPPTSMNFFVAGMLPSTTYAMYSQTATNGKIVNGNTLNFTTSALPTLPHGFYPGFTVVTPAPANDPNPMLLWGFTKLIVPVATDLNGNIVWYYGNAAGALVTRPIAGGTFLTVQNGTSFNSNNTTQQLLREIDLAGNTIRETNTGVVAKQLVAMGAADATPCGEIAQPAKVGDACLNDFHHEAIRYAANGQQYTAFFAHVEKLFPPGTQGNQGNKPVDVLSEMVVVLNSNWQVVWYYDAFDQLDINRTAPLKETCTAGSSDCPTNLFLAKVANDWTHANTIDYVAAGPGQNPDSGDFLISVRDQDQIIRIRYNNGAGNCAPPPAASCIVWYMGPPDGLGVPANSFTFNNIHNDPWPWFSHQHDATYANSGAKATINGLTGPLLTMFDNGNTRYSPPPLGLGGSCAGPPNDCDSRGMALIVDETAMQVTPVLLQNLGFEATALGSAQVLSTVTPNNYFFGTGLNTSVPSAAIEVAPVSGSTTGKILMNVHGSSYAYRVWQLPDLYSPPPL